MAHKCGCKETSGKSRVSSVVIRIMEHVLRTLKTENPELTTAFFRSNNAGCYHNSTMLAVCHSMGAATGITLSRVDFSDP